MEVLRWPEVKQAVGLSRATIRRLERAGQFPRRIQLSPSAVGWVREQVQEWLHAKCVAASGSGLGGAEQGASRRH